MLYIGSNVVKNKQLLSVISLKMVKYDAFVKIGFIFVCLFDKDNLSSVLS